MKMPPEVVPPATDPQDSLSSSGEGIAYHRLALQLHHEIPEGEGPRTVLLVTANTAPAAARVSIFLAHSLAEELQRKVLFVDAHPKGGDASALLGCSATTGYSDMLSDPTLRPGDLALPTSNPWVTVLPAGVAGARARNRSPQDVERLMRALAEGPDIVLLHGGPVLDDTMAMSLAPFVARVLLLAFENQTLLADLDLAQRALRACKARHVGLVIGTGDAARRT